MPIHMPILLFALSFDKISDTVSALLLAQAVIGTIFLIRFIAILQRFVNTEFPSTMTTVNNKLQTLHEDIEDLNEKITNHNSEINLMKYQLSMLTRRQDRLDETWPGVDRRSQDPKP